MASEDASDRLRGSRESVVKHGGLDGFAQEEVSDTAKELIGIFVKSRAINGLASVL